MLPAGLDGANHPSSPPTPVLQLTPLPFPQLPRLLCDSMRAMTTFPPLSRCAHRTQPAFSYLRSRRSRPTHARCVFRCPVSFRTPSRGDTLNEDPYSEVAPGHHPNKLAVVMDSSGERRRGLSDKQRYSRHRPLSSPHTPSLSFTLSWPSSKLFATSTQDFARTPKLGPVSRLVFRF